MTATRDTINATSLGEVNDVLARHEASLNGGSFAVSASLYGVVNDAQTLGDGAITNGQAVFTSATGSFKSTDVGKTIIVAAAGTAGDDLRTTISAFTSATQVTLAATAGATVSGATFSWGTDNKAALDAALTAVTPTSVAGRQTGGQVLDLGVGSILTSGNHNLPLNVIVQGHVSQATNIIHTGNNACFALAETVIDNYGIFGLRDIAIWGNNGSSAVGIQFAGKMQQPWIERVSISNYSNGVGILFWTKTAGDFVENINLYNIDLRYNKVGIEVRRTLGNASFAYQRWMDFHIHVPANGIGILVGDDTNSTAQCQLYSGRVDGDIHLEGDNAIAVQIGAFGWVPANTYWKVGGENPFGNAGVKALKINTGGVFYPRGFHDFGIDTFQAQPTMDVANATKYQPPTRRDERLQAQGLIAETMPSLAAQGNTAPGTGFTMGALADLRRGDVITGVKVKVNANGATLSVSKVGLAKTDGTLLASSADNSANFTAGSTPREQPTAFTAPYTVPDDGAYFLVFCFVGTTAPTLMRGASLASAAQSGTKVPFVQSNSGQTDLVTFAVNANGNCYWLGAY